LHVPPFSYWRPTFRKWLLYMNKYHEECAEAVNLYTLKQRITNLNEALGKLKKRPWEYM
jgi:hypothetical protein